ncbi:MAG: MarC family protein [Bacteroidetes bacterium]|nr:MAG: MarC family protein [Bacteroidota bacterium]RLD48448.1 MAG: MarC family protein [Bacteroidota bacterium]RLD89363.1 MAG: MarC family protein [Bacteroidota bacterium]
MAHNMFTFALTVFTGFFAIMNPIANTPIFLGLVEGRSELVKKSIARKSTLIAFLIVVSFTFLGKYIFSLFGITIPAFKIAGGILIFYVGFEMLMSKKSSIHSTGKEVQDDSIAISPLAIPILAGPGTIVTAMNFATGASFIHIGIVVAVFALMIFLTWLSFTYSELLVSKLGNNTILVIGKLMGLILAIIGTDMIIDGIKLAFNLS